MKTLRFLQFFVAILVTNTINSCTVTYTPPSYGRGGYGGSGGYGQPYDYVEQSPYGPIYHGHSPTGHPTTFSRGRLQGVPPVQSWPDGTDWIYVRNQ